MTSHLSTTARTIVQFDVTGWEPQRVAALVAAGNGIPTGPPITSQSEEMEPSGWDADQLLAAYAGLRQAKAYAQVKVIEQAALNSGFISRDDTYAITGFDPSTRSLKGFTRPVNRVIGKLQDAGAIKTDVDDLLETVYDPTVRGYQRALGFRVPADICQLITNS